VQQEKRRRVFGTGLSVKDGEPIYRCRAIKSRVFHGTFLSLNLGQQLKCGDRVNGLCRRSAERERESLHARIEKLDLELPISNGLGLSDQLIQPLVGNRTVALVVNVTSMSRARCLSIEEHAKAHGRSPRRWSHDQM